MKTRYGFVSNSSSSSYIIIAREELYNDLVAQYGGDIKNILGRTSKMRMGEVDIVVLTAYNDDCDLTVNGEYYDGDCDVFYDFVAEARKVMDGGGEVKVLREDG